MWNLLWKGHRNAENDHRRPTPPSQWAGQRSSLWMIVRKVKYDITFYLITIYFMTKRN